MGATDEARLRVNKRAMDTDEEERKPQQHMRQRHMRQQRHVRMPVACMVLNIGPQSPGSAGLKRQRL